MKASPLEFRFRLLLHALVFGLGLYAPWNLLFHPGPAGANTHLWGFLAAALAEPGWLPIRTAFDLLLTLGILFAFAAAALRTWGAAYLGGDVVYAGSMQTGSTHLHPEHATHAGVVADGPYRHLRNPLYLGTFLHSLALALLMPPAGALFTVPVVLWMQIRLILAEEAFLERRLGSSYRAYCALVPRLIPAIKPRVVSPGLHPRWPQAVLAELYMWSVAACFAVAGWRYNASLLAQCAIVSLGVSLVSRALVPKAPPARLPSPVADPPAA